MFEIPDPQRRVLEAVDGAHWVRWDTRTRRLFVWHPNEWGVAVYDEDGVAADSWLLNPNGACSPHAAKLAVEERLNAGY